MVGCVVRHRLFSPKLFHRFGNSIGDQPFFGGFRLPFVDPGTDDDERSGKEGGQRSDVDAKGIGDVAPVLGAGVLIAALLAGQLVASVALDHYGAFGLRQHSFGLGRAIGIALLAAGVIMVRRF